MTLGNNFHVSPRFVLPLAPTVFQAGLEPQARVQREVLFSLCLSPYHAFTRVSVFVVFFPPDGSVDKLDEERAFSKNRPAWAVIGPWQHVNQTWMHV